MAPRGNRSRAATGDPQRAARVRRVRRAVLALFGIPLLLALAVLAPMLWEAAQDPVVVAYSVTLHDWPAGERPRRIALLADTHALYPTMSPDRLRRIVAQVNALHPDIVVLGGDYVSNPGKHFSTRFGSYPFADAVAPFAGLQAPDGVFAVLGNHDYDDGDTARLAAALDATGVHTLVNRSVDLGPLVLGGIDDLWNGTPSLDWIATVPAGKPLVLASHNPDIFPDAPPRVDLVLSGHTHCGQIVPPLLGPFVSVSRYGHRYRQGRIDENGRSLIVTCGVGGMPLRWGAAPEVALVTVGP